VKVVIKIKRVNFLLRHNVAALLKYSKANEGGRGGRQVLRTFCRITSRCLTGTASTACTPSTVCSSLAQRLQRVPQVQSALHWHSVYSVYPKYSPLLTGTASTASTPSTVRSSLAQRLQRVSQVQSALHWHSVYSVYPKYSPLLTGTASTACIPSTVRSSRPCAKPRSGCTRRGWDICSAIYYTLKSILILKYAVLLYLLSKVVF